MLMRVVGDEDSFCSLVDEHLWPPPMAFDPSTWHAIHFVLSGSTRATGTILDFLQSGGTSVCEIYDARAFSSPEVRDLAEAMRAVGESAIDERCTRERIVAAGVYRPVFWQYPLDREEQLGDLRSALTTLCTFVQTSARDNRALLVCAYYAHFWGD